MFTMNTNTRLVLAFVAGIVSMIIIAGGIYLIRADFETAATLCGWYMVADGVLTFIGAAVYNFVQLYDTFERDTDKDDAELVDVEDTV